MTTKSIMTKDTISNNSNQRDYILATVIRTEGSVSVAPGFKARINHKGELTGWIGGGCIQRAVKTVAKELFCTKQPRLIRVRPGEDVKTASDTDGVELHKSGCPSKGVTDIFLEPVLANPQLVILGTSPVAVQLEQLCEIFKYDVIIPSLPLQDFSQEQLLSELENQLKEQSQGIYIVIATQGAGDLLALQTALELQSDYIGFVGSQKKITSLKNKLLNKDNEVFWETIRAPAGLNISAQTPEEIALSILSEITLVRRSASNLNDCKLEG